MKIQKKTVKANRVLITGAGGFIGGNLSAFLEHRGYDVTRFDINLGNSGQPDILNQDIVIHLGANSSTTETNVKKIVEENFAKNFSKIIPTTFRGKPRKTSK